MTIKQRVAFSLFFLLVLTARIPESLFFWSSVVAGVVALTVSVVFVFKAYAGDIGRYVTGR